MDMAEQLLEKDRLRELLAAEARCFRGGALSDVGLTYLQLAQRTSKRKESKSKIRELTVRRAAVAAALSFYLHGKSTDAIAFCRQSTQ